MKKVILIILGYILVAGLTFGITYVAVNNAHKDDECDCKETKKDDKKDKEKEKEKEKDSINYKKEVKNLCSKVDEDGNYNTKALEKIEDKLEQLEDDEEYDKMWDLLKGLEVCEDSICVIFEDNDSYKYHYYDCEEDEYESEKFDLGDEGSNGTLSANVILETACSNVNSKGNYDFEDTHCEDFICETKINGKTYTRDCTVN